MELGFAVVSVRTTGLSVESDRITGIAVVTTDARGRPRGEWATRLDPGATADPLRFGDVAGKLSGLLAGRVFAGHQAVLGMRFVAAEFRRGLVEMPAVPVLCTCDASRVHQPELSRRRLRDCCSAAGVEYDESNGVAGEARAAAKLLRAYLAAGPPCRELPAPDAAVPWPEIADSGVKPWGKSGVKPWGEVVGTDPAACGVPAELLDEMPLGDILSDGAPAAAGSYLELLAQTAENGGLSVGVPAEHGRAVGLGRNDLEDLHRGFVLAAARAAVVAGSVTEAVRDELLAAAEVLGLPAGGVQAVLAEASGELISAFGSGFRSLPHDWAYGEPLRAGQPVAFTGGEPYRRSRLELAAQLAGLRLVNRVSAETAVLVSGHSRPRSTKGLAAQRAGTRIVTPKVFEKLAAHVQPAGPGGKGVTAATIRAWARAHGHIVGPRGRLPRHVQYAFRAAHGRE